MAIRGIMFDLYGTLIDIDTDEGMEELYRAVAHYFTYLGVYMRRWDLRDLYYEVMKKQRAISGELYAEINVVGIWKEIMHRKGIKHPDEDKIALFLAQMYRGVSRKRIQLYNDVWKVLEQLKKRFPIALVSDAQACFSIAEMKVMGIHDFFDFIVISGDYGYRKPDPRLFLTALDGLGLRPEETIYVGNDMFRDMFGAKQLGIKTIFFQSNQGEQSYKNVSPDYIVRQFSEVPAGVDFLCKQFPWG
jgi:putative hydrolase of the HAD superfamily